MRNTGLHIRILPELRSKQVEDSLVSTPCEVLYFDTNYDLGSTHVPKNFHPVGLVGAVLFLLRSRAEVLEVPEPLWMRFLPKNAILILVWKLESAVSKRPRKVVTYAIENNEFSRLVGGSRRPPSWVVFLCRTLIGAFVSTFIDRIAFGSDGAAALYGTLRLNKSVRTQIFEQLPRRDSSVLSGIETDTANSRGAVFVGRFDERKGLPALMSAWPEVEAALPNATLTLVGDGPLGATVTAWCAVSPTTRLKTGRLDHSEIPSLMRRNSVVVAPSIPWGRWREQIGLPIIEGLESGATIVTTTETGLANWLGRGGHKVLNPADLGSTLASAVIGALERPIERRIVLESLPERSRRLDADFWLHEASR